MCRLMKLRLRIESRSGLRPGSRESISATSSRSPELYRSSMGGYLPNKQSVEAIYHIIDGCTWGEGGPAVTLCTFRG
jgi:hypothetical protein